MRHRFSRVALVALGAAALAGACTAVNNDNVFPPSSSTTTAGAGGSATQPGGTTSGPATGTGGDVGITIPTGTGNSGGNIPGVCDNPPDVDGDHDGWTAAEGDCNDCDPNVNPGAIDVLHTGDGGPPTWGDEDCDGTEGTGKDTCDANFGLNDVDPRNGARAIDLCQFTTQSPAKKQDKKWGVIDARYVRANGAPFSPGAQVGLMNQFGPSVHTQAGQSMLVISSGRARTPGQNGACGSLTCQSNLFGTPPPGFPQDNPACPPSSEINDDVGLELKLRSPTNATGYSFNFKFYSFEYPEWVCNNYNDQFIALVSPAPSGSINGNISFDSKHNPVSVNLGFFDVCDPSGIGNYASNCFGSCPMPPNPYCPAGTAELQGTGFDVWDDSGGTVWLKSQAPIHGGNEFTIRFAMWDTGDAAYDSTTLLDNFAWIANGGTVAVGTTPADPPQ